MIRIKISKEYVNYKAFLFKNEGKKQNDKEVHVLI